VKRGNLLLVLLLVIGLALMPGLMMNRSEAGDIPSQVHLGWSTNDVYTTMTVMWWVPTQEEPKVIYDLTSHDSPGDYAYSQEGTCYQIAPTEDVFGNPIETVFDGFYCRAELAGLNPGTTYYFRVGNGAGFTREWNFRTIGRNEVKFVFGGDSRRPYGNGYEVKKDPASPMNWPYARDFLTQAAAAEDPDFIIFGGDLIGDGNVQTEWTNWLDAWEKYAVTDDGRMIPVVALPGNHEMSSYPNKEASYAWFEGQFAAMPPYSLDFPNLHLVVLLATFKQTSSHGAWPLAEEEAESQLEWLKSDLRAAAHVSWKIVTFHVNYFGCFASGTGYPSEVYMKAWTDVFQEYSVDLVVMGHTHNYTRSWPLIVTGFDETDKPSVKAKYELKNSSEDGVTYIVAGGWGAHPDILSASGYCKVQPYIAAAVGHPNYSVAEVTQDTLHIVTKDTAGKVFDDITFPFTTSDFPLPEYEQVIR
jgi:Icc-related predicted phosphoesterase